MRLRSILAAGLALSPCVLPQGNNVQLLANLDQYARYNDVWGYRAPDGREYALLGASTGTSVVNTTNPTQPYQTGFIPGPNSTWRDIRTYRSFAYVVTEGGGGMQIVDLSNPESPSLVTTWGTALWGSAHNICIDTQTGRIFVVGTASGTAVIDASQSQTNPSFVGWYIAAGSRGYLHDLHVQNGLGHGAAINEGVYRIFDTTTWPFTTLSQRTTPSSFTHNAWPNANDTLAVTTDERTGAVVQVWDIANPRAPVARGSYTANPAAIPHNAFIVGDVVHMSFYTEGYRAVDISDPDNPTEIGYYDTWPGASGGFNGAWGCYPFQPSGVIYVSDISTGLYLLRVNRLNIAHTPLADTTDETGPYGVAATVTSGTALSSVRLTWSVNGGANTVVNMTPTGRPDEFAAAIPGQRAPATVRYSIRATNANGSADDPGTGQHAFNVGSFTRVYFTDFEGGSAGWTHGQTRNQDDWQLGAPAGSNGTSNGVGWSDPSSAWSGGNVWGNDLGAAGWNGRYQGNTSNWLQSPVIPTNGARGLKLRFRRWLTVEDGQFDQARIRVNNQVVWQNPQGSHTRDTAWELVEYDLSSITDTASTATIRFTLDTDGGLHLGGWNIDDVELFRLTDCVPPAHYGTGTAGLGGIVPTIDVDGEPRIGSTGFRVTGAAMRGGTTAHLAFGGGAGNRSILGVTVLVDPFIAAFAVPVGGAAGVPGVGTTALDLPIPNDPSLDDVDLFVQWLVVDSSAPGGFLSASDGMRFVVCRF